MSETAFTQNSNSDEVHSSKSTSPLYGPPWNPADWVNPWKNANFLMGFSMGAFSEAASSTALGLCSINKHTSCKKRCCICEVSPTKFVEADALVTASDEFIYLLQQDTSLTKTVTYLVENLGTAPVMVKLQISADGSSFADDNGSVVAEPGMVAAAVPYIFAKYTRIGVKTAAPGETSPIKIWYQAQI